MSAVFSSAPAMAQNVVCEPGSGVWNSSNDGQRTLEGALCRTGADSTDFYKFAFASQKGQFAPAIPGASSPLHFLFGSQDVLFYASADTVYALEKKHFRVVWHKPWPNAEILPPDPFDASHRAILSKNDGKVSLHLVQFKASHAIMEEMQAEFASTPLLIEWQQGRLIVVENNRIYQWTRPGSPVPQSADGTDNAAAFLASSPADWKTSRPISADINPPLENGDYMLDSAGLMVLNRSQKRLSYYRFDSLSWTKASINATAAIKSLGPGTLYAMGVTIDANTVRIVARLGALLHNRFEAKYWKLATDSDAPLVIGQDDIAALDGGSDSRIQLIDTTEMTWKRLALISYPAMGKIADLDSGTLLTVHPGNKDALIAWNARTGERISALPQSALHDASIQKAWIVRGLPRFAFVSLSSGDNLIFDTVSSETVYAPADKTPNQWSKLPQSVDRLQKSLIVYQENADSLSPTQWTVLSDTGSVKKEPETASLAGFDTSKFDELQTPQEKWYGYCLSEDDCFVPSAEAKTQARQMPEVRLNSPELTHKPTLIAWILAIFAFLSMFAVMAWRHGMGRKSMLNPDDSMQDDFSASTDIFDSGKRRFISDRDNRYFLAPSIVSTPLFRLSASILAGIIVALIVAVPYFFDDSLSAFVSWVVVLALPVTAAVWIVISWTYWNRYYLLRFGIMTEGKWLNCAQRNQSVAYAAKSGKSFELSRSQWHRADIVPLVLFDPGRENFAIQYTGGSNHDIAVADEIKPSTKSACTYDVARLFPVFVLLACTVVATQMLYKEAFPNPLSAWQLDSIDNNRNSSQTFTMACLNACASSDAACHAQCHHRQLSLVLGREHATSDDDPVMSPAEFLDTQRQTVAQARAILESADSCDRKESQLSALQLWPDDLTRDFWAVYSDKSTADAAELSAIYSGLKEDTQFLRELCDYDAACAHDASQCHQPPTCPGSIANLKIRTCSFERAVKLPE